MVIMESNCTCKDDHRLQNCIEQLKNPKFVQRLISLVYPNLPAKDEFINIAKFLEDASLASGLIDEKQLKEIYKRL
jgi:hypothetical protein